MMTGMVDIFYFDVDILILKNPWSNIYDRDVELKEFFNYPIHDLLFQQNCGNFAYGNDFSCDSNGDDTNGGQLYIKYSSKIHLFFDYMDSRKVEIIHTRLSKHRLFDQNYLGWAVHAANMSMCGLSKYHYTSYCQAVNCRSNDDASAHGIVTLHADCVGHMPGKPTKKSSLRKWLDKIDAERNNQNLKLGHIF